MTIQCVCGGDLEKVCETDVLSESQGMISITTCKMLRCNVCNVERYTPISRKYIHAIYEKEDQS